ncbi:MarR family winged helix-turn-helix transcriptional regulator [Kitasatospora fiedleri]|uniref:MarR family winged helix-turn-helix transcriptional regulator n=1 Tax=Kitasatospora fiedleri TaxID=2991545 RepID=UPI00249C5AD2|nr:MarR family transcriptional regulator [Kitasatospora fiedleri]
MSENPGPPGSAASAQRLNDAVKRLRARLRTESGQHATGLSPTQLGVLAGVVREGPTTAARLAAAERVSAQAIAQSLAVLRAAGLVHSEPDPSDGRKKLISAHAAAAELVDRLLTGRAAFLARAIDATVAEHERADLARAIELLERLADVDLRGGAG